MKAEKGECSYFDTWIIELLFLLINGKSSYYFVFNEKMMARLSVLYEADG